jgi:hypothetical protein
MVGESSPMVTLPRAWVPWIHDPDEDGVAFIRPRE